MEKKLFSIVGLLIIATIASIVLFSGGCSKINKSSTEAEVIQDISTLKAENANSASIQIKCAGTCENNETCGARWNLPSGIIECTCSGCVMSIIKDNPSGRSLSSRADMPKIAAHFVDYLKKTHGTKNYLITNYKQTFFELAEYIEIQYILNDNPIETFSLAFLSKFKSTDLKAPPHTVLVDCYGSCDTSAEKCVEVYNTNTGEVYCKCQSDNCKMKIEEVK